MTGAKLVIAKIDRLSRDAAFLIGLEASGSQLFDCLKLFSPARTSIHAIFFLPPYAFSTAASTTLIITGVMSTPVPSPSMYGMMG